MLELVEPSVSLRSAWSAAREDWGPGAHEDGFGLLPSDDVTTSTGFTSWLGRLASAAANESGSGEVAVLSWWIVEDSQVLGGVALRLGDDEAVHRLGHIGFGVRPSARRRGVASWALGRVLVEARRHGLRRVLLVCEAGNDASARTIEDQGGLLEDSARDGPLWRYWIGL